MKAAMDLVRYDEMKVRDSLMSRTVANLEEVLKRKDAELADKQAQLSRVSGMYANQSQIIQASDLRYKELEKKYKKSVRAGRFKVVLLGGTIAGAAYLLLK